LKQQREMWQATEKIKRDKWIQEKTKLIKDQTIQGLEPEIQKLISVFNH
jgi:5-azacytidine-induced protein 1